MPKIGDSKPKVEKQEKRVYTEPELISFNLELEKYRKDTDHGRGVGIGGWQKYLQDQRAIKVYGDPNPKGYWWQYAVLDVFKLMELEDKYKQLQTYKRQKEYGRGKGLINSAKMAGELNFDGKK